MNRQETHVYYQKILNKAAEKEQTVAAMAELGRKDLFFLLVFILNRPDADNDWVFARCREVQANPDGYLDLWAREHYKSSIITFALTIQDIINNPELTFGIFSFTRPIAKAFQKQIKYELETNTNLQRLYPTVFYKNPRKYSPKWSEDGGIVVKRKGNPKEATVEAWGLIDGQPTSKHFDVLIYNDIVTKDSVTTPEMIKKVTESWELSLNLGKRGGVRRYEGTIYHHNDTYNTIIKRKAQKLRKYPATEDGTEIGKPVFLTKEELEEKRRDMGPYVFSCQMLLDPKQESIQGFKEEWLKCWPASHYKNMNLYLLCDPASKKKKENDYTTFMILGLGYDKNYYVVTMVRDRLNLTERGNTLFALQRMYNPIGIGYEEYGLQADIEHFEYRMDLENYRFTITPLPQKGQPGFKLGKFERISRLIPIFEKGRMYLPENCVRTNYEKITEDLTKIFINEEYLNFPFSAHDDMLDCLARIMEPDFAFFPKGELLSTFNNVGLQTDEKQNRDYDPLRDW